MNTPLDIDTALAAVYGEIQKIDQRFASAKAEAFYQAGATYYYNARRQRTTDMTLAQAETILADEIAAAGDTNQYAKLTCSRYSVGSARETLADLAAISEARDEAVGRMRALEAQYTGWSRFFLVTSSAGGHIHSSMNCSTCRIDTAFGWLPELSGQTEAEAVAAHGAILCTVCFPSAPVEWTGGISHTEQAAKDEREAAKKARDDAKAAKAITDLDGSPLKDLTGCTIATEVTARREMSHALENLALGYSQRDFAAFAQHLAACIAAKTGEDAVALYETTKAKQAKKVAKWAA